MIERNQIKQTDLIMILKACGRRAITSQLPSCVKSFILPIAYMFIKESEPQKLLSIFEQPHELVWKWIEFAPKFTDDASKISYFGLLGLLKGTTRDN